MQQQRNLLLFFLLVTALMIVYIPLRQRFFPTVEQKSPPSTTKKKEESRKEPAFSALPLPPKTTAEANLLRLGEDSAESKFHLAVVLDPLGGGVRSVTLNKFKGADSFSGKPVPGEALELVPASANETEPSHLLYHFPLNDTQADRPLDTLGRRVWTVVKQGDQVITQDEVEGKARQQVQFRTELNGVVLTKTFTLVEGDYHVGLRLDLERPESTAADSKPVKFRYQLTGAKGLPVEGKWYTNTFRQALIALEDEKGYIDRRLQDLRQISIWAGGNSIPATESQFIRYAGVAVQYFASVVVVDSEQKRSQKGQKILAHARPTLEKAVAKGRVKPGTLSLGDRLVLASDDGKQDQTFYVPPGYLLAILAHLREGQLVAVVYQNLSFDDSLKAAPRVAQEINVAGQAEGTHALWEDDITVRLTSEEVELAPGKQVSHRYLLYNGPVKPSLLRQLRGDQAVDDAVIDRYAETLKLNTLTDYQSSSFFYHIGWTYLIIKCTNLMHWVLGKISLLVPSYGLAIILLTLLVRMMMFPLSRKQAMMGIKMQALQPELKKLAEKHKDDRQAYAQAQMALFRQHEVNPFGSCWVILLQMPFFMGLYFALQESIQFRLAPFWPTWITNLAAPDMMFEWGRWIPLISRDADYGGLLYLGPYFNLLPLITVALMLVQQKMMTPPAADKEQEMQQKMMRIMMIFFGLFFYKLAAGLCVYIITSTLWSFAERKLLPKASTAGKDPGASQGNVAAADRPTSSTAIQTALATPSGITTSPKKTGKGRRKDRGKSVAIKNDEPQGKAGQLWQRVSDWWNDLLEQARKK